jgi:hypothetical protein
MPLFALLTVLINRRASMNRIVSIYVRYTQQGKRFFVPAIVVAFAPGHPELSPGNTVFSAVKAHGMLVAGSEGSAIHPAAAAHEGEPIVD